MWLSIDDYYECSIDGKIRNKKTLRELKSWIAGSGYSYIGLGGSNPRKCGVHRIVGELFLPAPTEEGLEIDHIDRNKTNNHASNLRWVNHRENRLNIDLEKKPRTNNMLNELYIKQIISKRQINPTFVVIIKNRFMNVYKSFRSLEEAKDFRDTIINGVSSSQSTT